MEDSQLQYASPLHWGLVSKYRSQLFGFAILWIMCMHSREFTPLLDDAILSQYILYDGIILVGGVGVDIFLFLSGVGLYYAQEKGPTLGSSTPSATSACSSPTWSSAPPIGCLKTWRCEVTRASFGRTSPLPPSLRTGWECSGTSP